MLLLDFLFSCLNDNDSATLHLLSLMLLSLAEVSGRRPDAFQRVVEWMRHEPQEHSLV